VAREAGITEEEIGAAQAIVMAVSAGRIRAQVQAVDRSTAADRGGAS